MRWWPEGGRGGPPIGRVVVGLHGAKGERSVRSPTGADFEQQGGSFVGGGTRGTGVRINSRELDLPDVCTTQRAPKNN